MAIYLYNTLTKKKEEFVPLNPGRVNMYTCGVTVYDECHIGHARSLYIFEVIRNYLEFKGYKVKFVRNITDIDDKIINRARQLNTDWHKLAEKYIQDYEEILKLLNIRKAEFEPQATQHISSMIKNIQILIKKNYAYVTSSGVYFNVKKFNTYGKLSSQKIDEMLEGVRIEVPEEKKDPLDFALWKFSSLDEPGWESPWGRGRPGWHIECSTMAIEYLGETLDIHGGGRDLIFPHHENEIAQSEAITQKPFARYWIHHGLLTINGQKMAKSLGNFVSVRDVLKSYHVDVLKFFFLSCHYSHPLDFSWEKLKDFSKARMRFINLFQRLNSVGIVEEKGYFSTDLKIDSLKEEFFKAMDDDFNTAKAMAVLFKIVNTIDGYLVHYKENIQKITYGKFVLEHLLKIFGISLEIEPIEEEILEKIKLRNKLRESKDFFQADQIRKELKEKGIILEDTAEGTIYRKEI
jgi:cysteinyl-tRNA synthetase